MDKLQKLDVSKPEVPSVEASNLQELTPLIQAAIYVTVLDINDQLTITSSTKIQINPRFQAHRNLFPKEFDELEYRRHALTYLQRVGAIGDFNVPGLSMLPPYPWEKADVQVNAARFRQIKDQVIEAFNYKAKPEAVAPVTKRGQEKRVMEPLRDEGLGVVYEVKLKGRELLINEFLLTRLDFNSENDNVFNHLYQNPNKIISITELEKSLGGAQLRKPLHKIVENLGFTKELNRAFFDISKDAIRFRNPLTSKDLEELGISRLRLPRR